jgi:AcrR family transcriptional regulator
VVKPLQTPKIHFSVPGASPRGPRYDERFAGILATAARVIADAGYEKATMRKIASLAGVSIAGLYYYFESKEEVLYLIQFHAFDSLVKTLKARLAESAAEPAEVRIRLVVANHLDHFLQHLPELKVCARELESLTGEAYKRVLEKRREYYRITREIIDELAQRSEAEWDSDMAALALFGMLNWVYMWYNPRRHRDVKRLEAQLSGIFLDGIRPKRRRGPR